MSDEFEQELARRMAALEERMISVERTNDGFRDEERNVWVPGSLQMLTEIGSQVNALDKRINLFTKSIWAGTGIVAMLVAHQYGLAELLGKVLLGGAK